MKLHELYKFKITEEAIPIVPVKDLWDENEGNSKQYISATIYLAKLIPGKKNTLEVVFDEHGKRKRYGIMSDIDFNAAFVLLRPNQQPDAEGFLEYRSTDVYDAVKYTGDLTRVEIEDGVPPEKLNTGDYLLRQDKGASFVYTIEKSAFFDNGYVRKP